MVLLLLIFVLHLQFHDFGAHVRARYADPATVTGSLKRRGPALPGLRNNTP